MNPLLVFDALVAHLRESPSLEASEAWIERAAAEAGSHRDWEALLQALPSAYPEVRRRALAGRALEWAKNNHEAWGFRVVALFQAKVLVDLEAARGTLGAAEEMLREGAGRWVLGYEWGIVAEGHALCGLDRSNVARCLEAGWALAWARKDVEQLGRLTTRWSRWVDEQEAVARFRQVEAAAVGWGTRESVIYWWWHGLGLPEEGRRARHAALLEATRSETVLRLIRHWNLFEKPSPGIEAALTRAEALARSPEEWFALSRQAAGMNSSLQRRALDCAAAMPLEPRLAAQVAAEYVDSFEDPVAADRVGPRGLLPQDLWLRLQTLDGWKASPSDLFDWLRARMGAADLEDIARSDRGDDFPKHLAALQWICTHGRVPVEVGWHPGEVLRLKRWSSGDSDLAIAFCCVVLLLCSEEDDLFNTGAPLFLSCARLGPEASAHGEALLAWRWETQDPERPEAPLALLLLCMLRASQDPEDPRLKGLLVRMAGSGKLGGLRQELARAVQAERWQQLLNIHLAPLLRDPELAALLAVGGF